MNSSSKSGDVGLGSHTDLQCFTLLWQDEVGGLQILTPEGQWIMAQPIPGTLVVNIGDYLMMLTNDKFKSTVHRVFNCSTSDRISMPFFFGFNFNEKCGVLPTCIDESNPPKYEPISCAEVCQLTSAILLIEQTLNTNFILTMRFAVDTTTLQADSAYRYACYMKPSRCFRCKTLICHYQSFGLLVS